MPNTNAPHGLRPYNHQAGGTPARQAGYNVARDYATAIYSGDLVRLTGTGRNIEVVPNGTTARALGVFAGCSFVDASGDMRFLQYWPGVSLPVGRVVEAFVFDDPNLEFVIQATTIALADVGAAFEYNRGSGSTVTGRSGGYLDAAATSVPQLRVEGLAPGIDGMNLSEIGAFARVRVRILTHDKQPGSLIAV
jgi:hypothetical protein